MTIRLLTSADLDTFLPAIQEAYPALAREGAARIFVSDNPFIIVGDPAVPALARLEHYRLPVGHPVLSNQLATHVTDLYGHNQTIAAMAPFLAEVLGQLVERSDAAPAGSQLRAVAGRPVWAFLPDDKIAVIRTRFPSATVTPGAVGYSYIRRNSLRNAASDVAGLRP